LEEERRDRGEEESIEDRRKERKSIVYNI